VTYIVIITNEFYHFTSFKNSEAIGYCLATFLILILGFYGIKQTQIFTSTNNPVGDLYLSEEIPLEENSADNLIRIMEVKKPYLDPELNISRLSEVTGLTVIQLSSLLNNTLHTSFFDFINKYRVEEFKKQVHNPANKNLTLLGIGLNCGFNSKATFNRVFKNLMHITPKEYKEGL
jgi:AraC-like DNA-binding protein